jgi:hypothetical protein
VGTKCRVTREQRQIGKHDRGCCLSILATSTLFCCSRRRRRRLSNFHLGLLSAGMAHSNNIAAARITVKVVRMMCIARVAAAADT